MTVLTTRARNNLPDSVFAGPGRSYPIMDLAHAANAKARAKQEYEAGNLSEADYRHILASADAFERLHGAMKGTNR